MKRIPLEIEDRRLLLTAKVECQSLRISFRTIRFIIDTGSYNSYMSPKDSVELKIPLKERFSKGIANIGGSKYEKIRLPEFTFHLLTENDEYTKLKVPLLAFRTTKRSAEKIAMAQSMPSILGLNFLKSQKLSLHVYMTEDLAYLEKIRKAY